MLKNKRIIFMLILLFVLFLTASCVCAVECNMTDESIQDSAIDDVVADDSNGYDISGEGYVDASEAYVYLNEYRAEKGAWWWNSDDTTVTYFNTHEYNQIPPIERDAALEETAKIRAKEISELFDHVRPDGTMCYAIYPDEFYMTGENIAIANTAREVTDVWKEDFLPYVDQGHRGNMLNPYFSSVGIAGYRVGGITYWVQAFGAKGYAPYTPEIIADPSKGTLADLNALIGNLSEVKLEKDYEYKNDSDFANGIVIGHDLTLDGAGHSVDAKKLARIFNITADNVILRNVVFKNGNDDKGYGGAIYSSCKNMTLENCSFIGNNAYYGFALYSSSGNVSFTDCSFTDNTGVEGGINSNDGCLSVLNCSFTNNYAVLYGSAIVSNNCRNHISDCKFTGNIGYKGGAISLNDGDDTIINCSFINNIAEHSGASMALNGGKGSVMNIRFYNESAVLNGGALVLNRYRLSASNCSFIDNHVHSVYFNGFGGALHSTDSNITLEECNFTGNYIDSVYNVNGGAIFLNNNNASINNCDFKHNRVNTTYYGNGGAVFSIYSNVVIEESEFTGNIADVNGGALFSSFGNISVMNCSFTNHSLNLTFDTAGGLTFASCGGVMYSEYSNASVADCDFTDNGAYNGGAIYLSQGSISVDDCDFINSDAKWGGAIYSDKGNVLLAESVLLNNFASTFGGGIFSSDANVSISDSKFINNTVGSEYENWGGAVFQQRGNLLVESSVFSKNNALGGGALYAKDAKVNITDCSFTDNAAGFAGALYLIDGDLSIKESNFTNNSANYCGGALYLTKDKGCIADCAFENNSAINEYENGGAIYSQDSNVILKDSSFTLNSAYDGGAVYGCDAIGCTFTRNSAGNYAGAIYGVNNNASDCKFIENIAYGDNPTYNVATSNCIFEGNRIIIRAQFDLDFLEDSYYQDDWIFVNLFSPNYGYIYNATVTVRAFKGNELVDTISFLNNESWVINIPEGEYIIQFSVENQDFLVDAKNITLTILKNEIAVVDINVVNNTYPESTVADITSNVDGFLMIDIDNSYFDYVNAVANKSYQAVFNFIPGGNHTLTVTVSPTNPRVHQKTFKKNFTVFKRQTTLALDVENVTTDESVIVNVTASEDGSVEINMGSDIRTVRVMANVKTQIDLGVLSRGTYSIGATFTAGENYVESSASKTFNVFSVIKQDDIKISMPQNDSEDISVNLPGDAGGKITLKIAGESYEVDVIGGVANVKLPNLTGNNPYEIIYSGDDNYAGFTISGSLNGDSSDKNITLKPDIEITPFDDGICEVRLPGDSSGKIKLTINGNDYMFDVNSGTAIVALPVLANGNYDYSITYSGDDKYSSVSQNGNVAVINPEIIASDVNVIYSAGSYYQISVKGFGGKNADGVSVEIKINNKAFKTLPADSKGIVKFKIDQVPGTYNLAISALGKSVTKTLTVKHLMSLKKVTVKRSAKSLVLTASLAKINGKYLNGKKITFKFNGKTYTAKTDKKGVAKVTVKSNVLKKLKAGKKVTYQATYVKDTVKYTIKVKK